MQNQSQGMSSSLFSEWRVDSPDQCRVECHLVILVVTQYAVMLIIDKGSHGKQALLIAN